jgi:hypothetical protein
MKNPGSDPSEKVNNKDIQVRYISTLDQQADILPKGHAAIRFCLLHDKLKEHVQLDKDSAEGVLAWTIAKRLPILNNHLNKRKEDCSRNQVLRQCTQLKHTQHHIYRI